MAIKFVCLVHICKLHIRILIIHSLSKVTCTSNENDYKKFIIIICYSEFRKIKFRIPADFFPWRFWFCFVVAHLHSIAKGKPMLGSSLFL